MDERKVGFALCGSFCTHAKAIEALEAVRAVYPNVIPIVSERVAALDTRFGKAHDLLREIQRICDRRPLTTVEETEPIGPGRLLDALVICPCTGNTLAKLAAGIADTSVTMAAKAHLRNGRPLVVAVSTNDGLGAAAKNIAALLERKHVYLVPFRQDDPAKKPTSLVADFSLLPGTIAAALEGTQLQPLLLGPC